MPQPHLPLFPADVTSINPHMSFAKREGRVYYFFNEPMPVFSHDEKNQAWFQMFTSQLVQDGNCTQAEIVRAFGISTISMKRYVKKYREGGPARFFQKKRTRSAVVMMMMMMMMTAVMQRPVGLPHHRAFIRKAATSLTTTGLVAGLSFALSEPLNHRATFLNLVVGWDFEKRTRLFAAIDSRQAVDGFPHSWVAVFGHHNGLQLR